MRLFGGPLDGNAVDKEGEVIVWMYSLAGRPMAHRYDEDGQYLGEFELCGHAFPLWNEDYLAYDTHYCALWAGHGGFHMCMDGHFDEGEAVG